VKREAAREGPMPQCADRSFAIVVAHFYADLAAELVDGAMRALQDCGVAGERIRVVEVPGCFELPLACRKAIDTGAFDGVVALGVVIRGETPHFDYVAGECARGIMDVSLSTGTPIGFGVLTTENLEQARVRASRDGGDKGYAAAMAAAVLVQELTTLGRI
jgi:6,7-dimethyl-8-ribityllumazine synthase